MTDFDQADLLICDVSAVANDWLVTGRPLLITRTSSPQTREAATQLLQVTPRLTAAEASQAGSIAVEHITQDPPQDDRAAPREEHLAHIRPGASLWRLLDSCRDLSSSRDREWRRIVAAEGGELRNL